jgi:hypothetical protein
MRTMLDQETCQMNERVANLEKPSISVTFRIMERDIDFDRKLFPGYVFTIVKKCSSNYKSSVLSADHPSREILYFFISV